MRRLSVDGTFAIMLKSNTMIAMVLLLLSGHAFAEKQETLSKERMAFLYLSYGKSRESCKLSEVGGALKKQSFEFTGQKDKSNNFCVIQLSESEFNSNFRYCGLSSFDNKNNGQGACTFEARNSGYAFLAGVPNNNDGIATQACNFVCLTKTDGNKHR